MQGWWERLTGIVVKYKQKSKDALNASALSPEHTSLDETLEEISEKTEEADKLHNQTTQENAKKCLTICSEGPRNRAAYIKDPCWNNKTKVRGA